MTAVSILFLTLLAMAGFLIYQLLGKALRRFFRLRRTVFYLISISGTAFFFAAGCVTGILSLNALRSTEYARGLAQADALSASALESAEEKQRAASEAAWQEGYGEGFESGYTAALRTDTAPGKADTLSPQVEPESDPTETEDPLRQSEGGGDTIAPPSQNENPAEEPSSSGSTVEKSDGTENHETSGQEDTGTVPDGSTVYYTSGGSVLHRDRACSYLKKAKEVLSCGIAEAPDLPLCSRCG